MARVLSATIALVVLGMSGCGGDDLPVSEPNSEQSSEPGPHSGDCYAGTNEALGDLEPDYATQVPCTEPHAWEIVGTVDIPESLLDESSAQASRQRRLDLGTVSETLTPLRRQYKDAVVPKCDAAENQMTGVGALAVSDEDPTGARIKAHFGHAQPWLTIMPEDAWTAGRTQVVCSLRFHEYDDKPRMVRSADSKPVAAAFLTKAFPSAERSCIDGAFAQSPCEAPHMHERLWSVNAAATLGVSPSKKLTHVEQSLIDVLCGVIFKGTHFKMPDGHDLTAVPFPDDDEGWSSCMLSFRRDNKDLPMQPGFTGFAN